MIKKPLITVHLPPPLSERIGSRGKIMVEGTDIAECLQAVAEKYADFEKIIWPDHKPDHNSENSHDRLNPAILIFHQDEQIRANEINRIVKDGDQIDVIPAISGG